MTADKREGELDKSAAELCVSSLDIKHVKVQFFENSAIEIRSLYKILFEFMSNHFVFTIVILSPQSPAWKS